MGNGVHVERRVGGNEVKAAGGLMTQSYLAQPSRGDSQSRMGLVESRYSRANSLDLGNASRAGQTLIELTLDPVNLPKLEFSDAAGPPPAENCACQDRSPRR